MDRVDGYNGIYKDSDTGVIVNRGSSDRDRYLLAKRNALASKEEVNQLKDELQEIKSLLHDLINK